MACTLCTYLCTFLHLHRNHQYNPFDCHKGNRDLYIHHYDIHIRDFRMVLAEFFVSVILFEYFLIKHSFFISTLHMTQLGIFHKNTTQKASDIIKKTYGRYFRFRHLHLHSLTFHHKPMRHLYTLG